MSPMSLRVLKGWSATPQTSSGQVTRVSWAEAGAALHVRLGQGRTVSAVGSPRFSDLGALDTSTVRTTAWLLRPALEAMHLATRQHQCVAPWEEPMRAGVAQR